MAVTLATICDGLANVLATVPGVGSAYGVPQGVMGPLPCGMVFHNPELVSTVQQGAGLNVWTHELIVRLYVAPAKNVPAEAALARSFIEPFVQAVMANDHLGLTPAGAFMGADVTGYRNDLTVTFAGTEYVCVEWLVQAKAKYPTG